MLFKVGSFIHRQRQKASHLGLAFLVFSPLFFFRPLEDAYVLPQRLMALLGLALCFGGMAPRGFNQSRIFLAGLAFFFWRVFTHGAGLGPGSTLPWLVEQMVPLGTFILFAQSARQIDFEQRALRLTAGSLGLIALYALILLAGLDPWDKGAMDMGFLSRAHGSLGNPDFLAGLLVLALPGLALAWLTVTPGATKTLWLRGSFFLLVTLTLLLTQVRGAWLAAAIALPVAIVVAREKIPWQRIGALGVLGLSLVALLNVPGRFNPTGNSPMVRLTQTWSGDGAWAGRRFMATVAWNIAKKHPVLGVGPGRFQNAYLEEQGRLLGLREYEKEPYRFTADIHDDWLQILAESGWLGLLLFAGVFSLAVRRAWKRHSVQGASLVGLFVALGVHALFHFPLSIQASALFFWAAVGLAAAWDDEQIESSVLPWAWLALPLSLGMALTIRQTLASSALNSGTVLKDLGRPREAALLLQKAADLWPEDSRAWMRLGLAQDSLGQGEESVQSFMHAARVLPGLPEAWSNLGLALGKSGNLLDAQAASEQALSLNPRSGEAWSNLAKLRYMQNDSQGAIKDLEAGISQAGPSALLYFNLGAVHMNLGHRKEAQSAFEACLKLQPEHAEARRLLTGLQRGR